MRSLSKNIHVQSTKFYPARPWKNILNKMLEYLQKEGSFNFQNVSLELILVRDNEMATYNHTYMDCTGPTNILSFPHDETVENNDSKRNDDECVCENGDDAEGGENKEYGYREKKNISCAFLTPPTPFTNLSTTSPASPFTAPVFEKKKHSSKSKSILRSNLGTLVLSVDTLERECILYGQTQDEHATHLLAHGLAHLLGYDHGETMQQLTELLERNISYKNTSYTFIPVWSYCHG